MAALTPRAVLLLAALLLAAPAARAARAGPAHIANHRRSLAAVGSATHPVAVDAKGNAIFYNSQGASVSPTAGKRDAQELPIEYEEEEPEPEPAPKPAPKPEPKPEPKPAQV